MRFISRACHCAAALLLIAFHANGYWDDRFFLSGINGEVRAIAVRNSDVYAGGNFNSADNLVVSNIARWNGTNWSALRAGVNGAVNAIAVGPSAVYVGGVFTAADGAPASRIARWNGTNWSGLASGIAGTRVTALALDATGMLYAGGEFTNAGGVVVANIAKWDGTNWAALGTGLSNDPYAAWVLALAVRGSDLYAGGFFTDAGGVSVSCIAKWDGTAWSALGGGVDDVDYLPQVTALAVRENDLYVGGAFTRAGNVSAAHVAKWNGSGWSALGAGLTRFFGDIPVATLAVSGENLLVGGRFLTAGGLGATNLARWNGAAWSEFGGGAAGTVKVLAVEDQGDDGGLPSNVYAGGSFTVTNSSRPFAFGRWNTGSWSNVAGIGGQGLSSPASIADKVAALAVNGSNVYAAGSFSSAGELSVANIARWDGASWHSLGAGLNGPVFSLALSGGNLFSGGEFTLAGGVVATNIARWNGTNWLAVGGGVSGPVHAFAVSGNDLYVGGAFATAGNTSANNIARWDGSQWSPLGNGVNGPVYAVAIAGNRVYAGGKFTVAGASPATNVALWNGSDWAALGAGVSGIANPVVRVRPPPVSALAIVGGDLYVGGDFASAGGLPATNIARWDGTNWWPVGGGVSGITTFAPPPAVSAFAFDGRELFVGGTFIRAGPTPVNNVARWDGANWRGLGDGVKSADSPPATVETLALQGATLIVGGHFKFAGGRPASDFCIWHERVSLQIQPVANSVKISWPAAASSYVLESSDELSPISWQAVTNVPLIAVENATVMPRISAIKRFYRLRQP